MKRFSKLISLIAILAFGLAMVSCSSDDDGGSDESQVTVTFNANGGTITTSAQKVTKSKETTLKTASELGLWYEGYIFLGWANSSTATNATYTDGQSVTFSENTTLYAVWKADALTYTVTFNANGGTITTSSQIVTENKETALSSASVLGLSRSDYAFVGWATTSDSTTAAYADGATVKLSENITLYALWVSTNSNAVSANADGTYTVTPYNIAATLAAIAGSGATSAKCIVTDTTTTTLSNIKSALDSNTGVRVSIDLSESTSLTYIPQESFADCKNLVSIVIPGSVEHIGGTERKGGSLLDGAFSGCNGLKTVVISEGTKSIGRRTFSSCSGLNSITIPASVTSIETQAFLGVGRPSKSKGYGLDTVTYGGTLAQWCSIDFSSELSNPIQRNIYSGYNPTALMIENENYSGFTSITVPDGITSIRSYTFYNFAAESIILPESVTSIENFAFYECTALTKIEIPGRVTSIGDSAFYDCKALAWIKIPESVTAIGKSAFYGCSALEDAIFDDTTSIWYASSSASHTNNDEKIGAMSSSNSANAKKLKETYLEKYLYNSKYSK